MDTIYDVGRWIMLGIGALVALAGIYGIVIQKRQSRYMVVAMTVGLLFMGLVVYGPGILIYYKDFLQVLTMVEAESPQAYQAAFDKIGKGDFDPTIRKLALVYALKRPTTDMDSLLAMAIDGATNDEGKYALLETQTALAHEGKDEVFRSAVMQFPDSSGLYDDLVQVVLPMTRAETPETYQTLFYRIGKGDFDTDLGKIALTYALYRSVPNMDSLLTVAIGGATHEPGQAALTKIQDRFRRSRPADRGTLERIPASQGLER